MAKRFRFRFETLLKIRRQREDQHKRIVADRVRQVLGVRDRIGALRQQIDDGTYALRTVQEPGTIDIQQAVRHRHWLGYLHRSVLQAEARMRELEARLAQERADLAEAAKQRRIIEKLKQHRWERHRREQDTRDAKEADEMATMRYVADRCGAMSLASRGDPRGGPPWRLTRESDTGKGVG